MLLLLLAAASQMNVDGAAWVGQKQASGTKHTPVMLMGVLMFQGKDSACAINHISVGDSCCTMNSVLG